ncbi:ectonucleotide pyrophosphatase/phosphodiesterase [Dokdonella sp.]|uniref:alkaline phosphatase family protein n=1 Tax=Dokdonella sp. TaxID=2291710 RepID=UPI0025C4AD33|nr:ectonucleotide pyrophosphatase/phosphodiesterase [Dokdonella sp.]MBX3688088.1 alkaline phosphatase family protein [Dokdonella sp.]
MRRLSLLIVFLLVIATGCAQQPRTKVQAQLAARPLVILVSIDGFRPDFLQRQRTPTLKALADEGVRAVAMKPAFPSLTFPNHYTLVTGLYPDHHGIINNRFKDPASGDAFIYKDRYSTANPHWWGGEPIWVTAQKQGLRTATMFWPGSDVAIAGVRPDHWLYFDGAMTPNERVDHLLRWIDLPLARRPQFLTLYFDDVDHAGHGFGPDSKEVNDALGTVDAAIARLVAGLRDRGLYDQTDLVIVSDHGSAATKPELRTYLDDVVPLDDVKVDNYGVVSTMTPKPGKEAAVDAALLKPHPHMSCWRKGELPARFHYGSNPRLPPIVCVAEVGGMISTHEYDRPGRHPTRGEHGYDNDAPQMQALFIARGPDFRRGLVLPEFDNVDVYPLLAHLLRIQGRPNDGKLAPLLPALREGSR